MTGITEFFNKMYENTTQGCIEIRTLPNREQAFFELNEIKKVAKYCAQSKSDQNVYFGVGTRKKGDVALKKELLKYRALG